mgnify:CR=1 FL=1
MDRHAGSGDGAHIEEIYIFEYGILAIEGTGAIVLTQVVLYDREIGLRGVGLGSDLFIKVGQPVGRVDAEAAVKHVGDIIVMLKGLLLLSGLVKGQ